MLTIVLNNYQQCPNFKYQLFIYVSFTGVCARVLLYCAPIAPIPFHYGHSISLLSFILFVLIFIFTQINLSCSDDKVLQELQLTFRSIQHVNKELRFTFRSIQHVNKQLRFTFRSLQHVNKELRFTFRSIQWIRNQGLLSDPYSRLIKNEGSLSGSYNR